MAIDIQKIRADFPVLSTKVHGKPLLYLDNGATTQKPRQVIERIKKYYEEENSNVHRGVHYLSQLATDKYEAARAYIARYINAASEKEIVFTRGTTESINLLATILEDNLSAGDEMLITAMEHHSNMVPWQQLCLRKKAKLKVVPVTPGGEIDMAVFSEMLSPKVKLVAFAHISNVLGTINPVKEMTRLAHKRGAIVIVDGAQALAHTPVDVQEINCDFYAFSAHKAYGPMGIGGLYGRESLLDRLPPYQFGGEMIDQVAFDTATFNASPQKFEAGTPNVAGVLGMETALRYIEEKGIENIQTHEDRLLEYATNRLEKITGMQIIGQARQKTAVLSFVVDGLHPYDLGTLLDQMGIAVRTGNHCAQPLVESYGLTGTVRASLAMYNTLEEIDLFVDALQKAIKMLR
ncbi:MAG: cysteine desulfurase [Bacteroidales bacterium]|nr:cysteine desulfurase [Bacteroidales bacterium]